MRLKVQRSGQCKSIGLGNLYAPLRYQYSNSGRSQRRSFGIAPIDPRETVRSCIQPTIRSKVGHGSLPVCVGGTDKKGRSVNPAWSFSVLLSQLEMSGVLRGSQTHVDHIVAKEERERKKKQMCRPGGEAKHEREEKPPQSLPLEDVIENNQRSRAGYKLQIKAVMFVPSLRAQFKLTRIII